MTAKEFIETLHTIGQEYLKSIPKREIFSLAKEYQHIPVHEVVKLLRDKNQDHRLGAVSILDWKARNKKTSPQEKKEIFHAYIENHKWIDDWGLVDRAAPYVVGGYLYEKKRKPLYDLAKSKNPMERRTAIVSTYFFIRKNEIEDTFNIAEIYSAFANALVKSERPKKLNEDELEEYNYLLEDQAYPFEEKAISVHEKNMELLDVGIYNEWVDKSISKLSVLYLHVMLKLNKLIPFLG